MKSFNMTINVNVCIVNECHVDLFFKTVDLQLFYFIHPLRTYTFVSFFLQLITCFET